ncbi:hypothetical protein D9M68_934570 [compost metagenome]
MLKHSFGLGLGNAENVVMNRWQVAIVHMHRAPIVPVDQQVVNRHSLFDEGVRQPDHVHDCQRVSVHRGRLGLCGARVTPF